MARGPREYCEIVLAAIIPDRLDLMDKALRSLTQEHFTDKNLQNIFKLLEYYYGISDSIASHEAVEDMLTKMGKDQGTILALLETYDYLHGKTIQDADFKWAISQLREHSAELATGEALNEAMEILRHGVEVKGEVVKGQEPARAKLIERLAVIDRDYKLEESPEGNVMREADQILAAYEAKEKLLESGLAPGVMFGVPGLDDYIGGLQKGELAFISGFVGTGKTHLAVQLAWNASVTQGLHVVYATTETLREQVNRRLVCRHSKLEKFGLRNGINSNDIRKGSLSADEKEKFYEIVRDFTNLNQPGACNVIQMTKGTPMSSLEGRLIPIHRRRPIDLLIIDDLRYMETNKRRSTDREEYTAIIKEGKWIATGFDGGNGLPVLSPWQIKREAYDKALDTGYYTKTCMADAAEAERSADWIITMLKNGDDESRKALIKGQILKARDGEEVSSIPLKVDYATSYFANANEDNTDIEGLLI